MREVAVVGVGMCSFQRRDNEEYWEFAPEAVINALKDADMEFKQIQAAFCGSVYQGTGAGHRVLSQTGRTGIPIVNVENACSSGASAFRLCYQSIATGLYDICLAVGFEKMPRGFISSTAFPESERWMGFNVQPANYALWVRRAMEDYGYTREQFAKVTVKNRKNAILNPYAFGYARKEVTVEEVLNSRMISDPLTFFMCCPVSDGAAAAILVSKDMVKSKKPVTVAASVLRSAMYGGFDLEGGGSPIIKNQDIFEASALEAYNLAGIGPEDIDVAELYDPFSPGEVIDLPYFQFCDYGEGGRLIDEGETSIGGRLPVNTGGGLMGRGHPLGATSLAQIHDVVLQLRGQAGPRQVEKARVALTHSVGAGPNSAVTILKI